MNTEANDRIRWSVRRKIFFLVALVGLAFAIIGLSTGDTNWSVSGAICSLTALAFGDVFRYTQSSEHLAAPGSS